MQGGLGPGKLWLPWERTGRDGGWKLTLVTTCKRKLDRGNKSFELVEKSSREAGENWNWRGKVSWWGRAHSGKWNIGQDLAKRDRSLELWQGWRAQSQRRECRLKWEKRGGTQDWYLEQDCGEAGKEGQGSRGETAGWKRHRRLFLCHDSLQDPIAVLLLLGDKESRTIRGPQVLSLLYVHREH